jgi:hypothetical protein
MGSFNDNRSARFVDSRFTKIIYSFLPTMQPYRPDASLALAYTETTTIPI